MDNTYNIDFVARCIAGHNKTAIKSIKNNISLIKQVPSVESTDAGKVLTASYNNGTGEYSWQPASGGGGNAPFIIPQNLSPVNDVVNALNEGRQIYYNTGSGYAVLVGYRIVAHTFSPTDWYFTFEFHTWSQSNIQIMFSSLLGAEGGNLTVGKTISKNI